jgi:hypothetical protein
MVVTQQDKLALITELAKRSNGKMGRTALMKCLFLLRQLRDVPVSYDFRLYTHGPFDSDVLNDLQYAQALGAINSRSVTYPGGGRGYELHPGPQADAVKRDGSKFVNRHSDSIDWVLSEFGKRTTLDLEMASTLIFVDRTNAEKRAKVSITDLAKTVHSIKPHLSIDVITREAKKLRDKGHLVAAA